MFTAQDIIDFCQYIDLELDQDFAGLIAWVLNLFFEDDDGASSDDFDMDWLLSDDEDDDDDDDPVLFDLGAELEEHFQRDDVRKELDAWMKRPPTREEQQFMRTVWRNLLK